MKAVAIQPARVQDLPAVVAFAREQEDAPAWPSHLWETFLEEPDGTAYTKVLLLLWREQQQLQGLLAATQLDGVAELEFVLVDAATRRGGWGRQLVQHWLALAAARGAAEALLEVRASNDAALSMYRGLGFQEQGRRAAYYHAPTEDAVLMRLPLQAGQGRG